MADWWKYPDEAQRFECDWSTLLDGDTISGAVVATSSDPLLVIAIVSTVSNITIVKISGGTKKTTPRVVFLINTAAQQIFTPVKHIEIRPITVAD